MKLIVHYPTDAAAQAELARRVAQVHAEAAIRRIQNLPAGKEEKTALLRAVARASEQTAASENQARVPERLKTTSTR